MEGVRTGEERLLRRGSRFKTFLRICFALKKAIFVPGIVDGSMRIENRFDVIPETKRPPYFRSEGRAMPQKLVLDPNR